MVAHADDSHADGSGWLSCLCAELCNRTFYIHVILARIRVAKRKAHSVGSGAPSALRSAPSPEAYIEALSVSEKPYLDVGTAEDLVRAVQHYALC